MPSGDWGSHGGHAGIAARAAAAHAAQAPVRDVPVPSQGGRWKPLPVDEDPWLGCLWRLVS